MLKLNVVGTVFDTMGYGEFARNFSAALYNIKDPEVSLSVEPISFERVKTEHGQAGEICKKLSAVKQKPDVNIVVMIPPLFKRYSKPGTLNIGFTMFETSRIPNSWVENCNQMDAIFVPSTWNKRVFEKSGVKVPVFVVSPGIEVKEAKPTQPKDMFSFYSIFQWTPRKSPSELIRAYWGAFTGNDRVELVLKTYRRSTERSEQNAIAKAIGNLRNEVKLSHYPKVRVIGNLLTKEEMAKLHYKSHCFVLPHKAEGLGLPHLEAMSFGKPVIATGYSGNMEFMNETNSYPINYTLTPVFGMNWFQPWYEGDMLWAEPDLQDLMEKMKFVYNNYDQALQVGHQARSYLQQNFSWKSKGKHLLSVVKDLV